jgi:hypothetical protein
MSDAWWPATGPDKFALNPAFTVRRSPYGALVGGDYTRGSSGVGTPPTAVRFAGSPDADSIANQAILYLHPADYSTIAITWGVPPAFSSRWAQVAIVRSAFGRPFTPQEGVTIYKSGPPEFESDSDTWFGPTLYDTGLNGGFWYYYTAFFQVSDDPGSGFTVGSPNKWSVGIQGSVLLPRNFHHAEHLWGSFPPYWQTQDDNIQTGTGPVRRLFQVVGFEMDTAREFVESLQKVQSPNWSPMRLLTHIGENMGAPFDRAIGDINYRSYLSRYAVLMNERGTISGLLGCVRAASKYDCGASPGSNLMVLTVDSTFDPPVLSGTYPVATKGVGDWCALYPAESVSYPDGVPPSIISTPPSWADYTDVTYQIAVNTDPAMTAPSKVLDITTTVTPTIMACGWGFQADPAGGSTPIYIDPRYRAIPVAGESYYGLTLFVNSTAPVELGFMWLSYTPDGFLGFTTAVVFQTFSGSGWIPCTVVQRAPAGAAYGVPLVQCSATSFQIAGSMVFAQGEDFATLVPAFTGLLLMGDLTGPTPPYEDPIGIPPDPSDSTFKGRVLGEPST